MTTAKIRRLAARAHRGQTLGRHGDFVAHLERVAAAVAEQTRCATAAQAAWLYATPAAGVSATDLHRVGVSPAVVDLVQILQERPDEPAAAYADRLLRTPDAARVRWAVLSDLQRHRGGESAYETRRKEHARLADGLDLPRPDGAPLRGLSGRDLATLIATRPGPEGHWGPVARALGDLRDADALPYLLAAYDEVNQPGRNCCLVSVQAAIHAIVSKPGNVATGPVAGLVDRWWDSADPWEQHVAVWGRAAGRDPAHRAALLTKLGSDDPGTVSSAIPGLTGAGDDREIALLRAVVLRTEPHWRWARRVAVARLHEIGGPQAAAVLRERRLDPIDPPWRTDPSWLAGNGADAVATLIGHLGEPLWWHEGPYALGELRAAEAVPSLCELTRDDRALPIPAIEALGKIGSADAVPALLACARHPHPLVREHALRALNHLDDPRVVDAAIEACADEDPAVRDRAARVLADHGDERAVPQLIRLCDTAHAARAARALTRIGDPRALPTLWHLFQTATDRAVRHAAGQGLARIDGPYRPDRSGDVRVRRAYVWLLGHKPQWRPQYQLKTAATDDDPIVRARAAEALGRLGGPDGAEQVRGLVADPDPRVRAAAATALRLLEDAA